MKRFAFLVGAAGLGLVALLATQRGHAADHFDAPMLVTSPMADVNDVYAWMEGSNLNLAMSISPADFPTRTFGPDVLYVFHVHSKAKLGVRQPGTGLETRVICRFASNTSVECWVAEVGSQSAKDYITGDPSNAVGITSESGKVRMYAGRASDPFAFNLNGFRSALAKLTTRFGSNPPVQFDAAGCPSNLSGAEVPTYANDLGAMTGVMSPCSPSSRDCFSELNVRVIVIQLEKSLVNVGANFTVGVWGATHAKGMP